MVTLDSIHNELEELKEDVAVIKTDIKWFKGIMKWMVVGILALFGVQAPMWL